MSLRSRLLLPATLVVGASCCGLSAQLTPRIDEATARENVVKQVDPVLPPSAKNTHLSGDVVLELKLTAKGTVESVTVASGAPALRSAAMAAVKQWIFKPTIIDGFATSVITRITLSFPSGGKKVNTPETESPKVAAKALEPPRPVPAQTETAPAAPPPVPQHVEAPSDSAPALRERVASPQPAPASVASSVAAPQPKPSAPEPVKAVAVAPATRPPAETVRAVTPDSIIVAPATAGQPASVKPASSSAPLTVQELEQKTLREYTVLEEKCHGLVASRAEPADQAAACTAAADKAEQFGTDKRFLERRSAYVYAATALLRNRDFKQAVQYGDRAIEVTKQGHDDNSGTSAAYAIKGQAEAYSDKLADADLDLARAEMFQRAAMDTEAGRAAHASYAKSLKGLLQFRSQVLDALGKTDEAKRLADEANTL